MASKDYIQILALIATIITSNWIVSRQIKKNKKSGWIEDFRKEVATFLACGFSITTNPPKEELLNVVKSSTLLLLLLDADDEKQKNLINKIARTTIILSKDYTVANLDDFQKKFNEIISLAKVIIFEQTKKL
ncbi:MAG: hypothetical protein ACOH2V_14430 [Candidatus Saccharimonadaceae bacterium]